MGNETYQTLACRGRVLGPCPVCPYHDHIHGPYHGLFPCLCHNPCLCLSLFRGLEQQARSYPRRRPLYFSCQCPSLSNFFRKEKEQVERCESTWLLKARVGWVVDGKRQKFCRSFCVNAKLCLFRPYFQTPVQFTITNKESMRLLHSFFFSKPGRCTTSIFQNATIDLMKGSDTTTSNTFYHYSILVNKSAISSLLTFVT